MLKSFKIITLALLVAVGFNLHAQPVWFPENAEWYYHPFCFVSPGCGFVRYFTDGDTLIDGVSASVVRLQSGDSENTEGDPVDSFYFRHANDTVYLYSMSSGSWGMLYDMSAQPGDVWDLSETFDLSDFGDDLSVTINVDSVTTEMLGGMMRRVVHTSAEYDDTTGEGSFWEFRGPIVEGVGPIEMSGGLLGDVTVAFPGGFPPYFACFRVDGEIVIGSDDFPCGIVSGIEEEEHKVLGAYPNPTNQHVWLDLPPSFDFHAEVSVYNSVGQLVQRHTQFSGHEPLSLPHPPGLYIIEARRGERAVRAKVVVR